MGLTCRFPGAESTAQFWDNLVNGVEGLWYPTVEELSARGVPETLLRNKDFVRVSGALPEEVVTGFDQHCFGVTAKELAWTDPQHRLGGGGWGAVSRVGSRGRAGQVVHAAHYYS